MKLNKKVETQLVLYSTFSNNQILLNELNKIIKQCDQYKEENERLKQENKDLRLQADTYFDEWQKSKLKAQAFDEVLDAVNASYVEYPEDWMVEVLKVVRNFEQERDKYDG